MCNNSWIALNNAVRLIYRLAKLWSYWYIQWSVIKVCECCHLFNSKWDGMEIIEIGTLFISVDVHLVSTLSDSFKACRKHVLLDWKTWLNHVVVVLWFYSWSLCTRFRFDSNLVKNHRSVRSRFGYSTQIKFVLRKKMCWNSKLLFKSYNFNTYTKTHLLNTMEDNFILSRSHKFNKHYSCLFDITVTVYP